MLFIKVDIYKVEMEKAKGIVHPSHHSSINPCIQAMPHHAIYIISNHYRLAHLQPPSPSFKSSQSSSPPIPNPSRSPSTPPNTLPNPNW